MKKETEFTPDEAVTYLMESIEYWKKEADYDKIISLAKFAYNRREKTAVSGHKVKYNLLMKQKNTLIDYISRSLKIDPKEDMTLFEGQKAKLIKDITEMEAKDPKLTESPKKRNSKK